MQRLPTIKMGKAYDDGEGQCIHIHTWENGIYIGQIFTGGTRMYDIHGHCLSDDIREHNLVVPCKAKEGLFSALNWALTTASIVCFLGLIFHLCFILSR